MLKTFALVFTLSRGDAVPPDRWLGPDKVQHFFTSAVVQSLAYGALRSTGVSHGASLAGASTATAAVGVWKEVKDYRSYGLFSRTDLVWDAAGAGAATVLLSHTVR